MNRLLKPIYLGKNTFNFHVTVTKTNDLNQVGFSQGNVMLNNINTHHCSQEYKLNSRDNTETLAKLTRATAIIALFKCVEVCRNLGIK